ncbi:MAG: hypothetical protein Q4F38_07440 [Akkermansia sp.]|nr:hypothetical protein [Akkermansia sp.]
MADILGSGRSRGAVVLRLIALALLVFVCVFKMFLTYRGLDQPAAMDQAQIARAVAQGKGFVTSVLRPVDVVAAAERTRGDKTLDFNDYRDTTHAPLNIAVMAVALKLTGYDNFDSCRMTEGDGYVYAPDRVIAATSMFFFVLAMVLAYMLAARLFDEVVACASTCFLVLSDLLLQYSVSGLPQPLMMCCMLGSLHALLSACRAYQDVYRYWALFYVVLAAACAGLMTLSGWMGLWPALGLLLFCCFYFRPAGSYALAAACVLVVCLLMSAIRNYLDQGSVLGNAMLGLYNSFGNGEDLAMRAADLNNRPMDSSYFALKFLGHTFGQLRGLYVNMGSIIVVPFFLLALLNPYRRSEVQAIKWAVFSMWGISCVGMALFGVDAALHESQLAILFAPLFTAYGVALVFNFLSRLKSAEVTFNQVRGLAMFIMVCVSAGPFLATLPRDLYLGIWLGDRGRPHFPPYYPPALNDKLVKITSPNEVIVTDQPWAVAWYANRKALWIPTSAEEFTTRIEPSLQKGGTQVQGFLITPSSHSAIAKEVTGTPGGMAGIMANMGDFAPLAMEGKILQIVPRHNVALADFFIENISSNTRSVPMGQIVSSRGRFSSRVPLLGAELLYYGRTAPTNQ